MPGRKPPVRVLITAEHASWRVPGAYQALFVGSEAVLESHRAWDPGTRQLARDFSRALNVPLLEGKVTRLLVDLNRSRNHRGHLSEFSRTLSVDDRARLIDRYWQPHWNAFRAAIEQAPGQLIHVACHSFSPVLNGNRRNADIGLLYDPSRKEEKLWCQQLAQVITEHLPALNVRMNYPYRGVSNGMGQQHRRMFDADRLLTMELEINSALVTSPDWVEIRQGLIAAIGQALLMTSNRHEFENYAEV